MINYQFLLEIDALNASHVPVTLHFCCQPGFTGGGYTWYPRIVDSGLIQTALFSGDKITGKSSASYGEVILGNFKNVYTLSGPTDYLKDYTFYGRAIRMYMGLVGASYPSGFPQVYSAIIENSSIEEYTVTFTLRGRQSELDIPFETGLFLGNNSAPAGVEGIVAMANTRKPALIGRAFNFAPTLCNPSRLIYAISPLTGIESAKGINSNFQVFDSGVELFCDNVVDNYNAMMDPNPMPQPGKYKMSPDGYLQLGSTAAGQVTCSGASRGRALISTPVALITQIFTLADATPGRTHANFLDMIDDETFTGYTDTYDRGIFIPSGSSITISKLIDLIVSPCGYWYFTPLGKLRVRLMILTGYTPNTFTLVSGDNGNIANLMFKKTGDTKGGIPASKITIKCGKNYTIQATVAGSVDTVRAQRVATQWLSYTVNSTGYVYPSSEEFVIETALSGSTYFERGVYSLGNTFKDMLCYKHDLLDIEVITSYFLDAKDVEVGSIITVNLQGRFNYTNEDMMVVSKTVNNVTEVVNFTLWRLEGV